MVTLNVHASDYGSYQEWDAELILSMWRSAAQNCWPDQTDPCFVTGPGVNLPTVGRMIAGMVDFTGEEILLIGRTPVLDGLLDEMMQSPSHDVNWADGNRLETVGWWRGCLLVRMVNWHFPLGSRIHYKDGTVIETEYFPQNELWFVPLADARLGQVHLMYRYIDTTLPAY